jgi:hypothetical protein
MAGNTVIRAFKKEEESNERIVGMLNRNCLSNSITTAVWAWYSIRVDMLSMLVLTAGCFSCIWLKSEISPVLLGLALQYLLTLQDMCNYGLESFGEIERKMICI